MSARFALRAAALIAGALVVWWLVTTLGDSVDRVVALMADAPRNQVSRDGLAAFSAQLRAWESAAATVPVLILFAILVGAPLVAPLVVAAGWLASTGRWHPRVRLRRAFQAGLGFHLMALAMTLIGTASALFLTGINPWPTAGMDIAVTIALPGLLLVANVWAVLAWRRLLSGLPLAPARLFPA